MQDPERASRIDAELERRLSNGTSSSATLPQRGRRSPRVSGFAAAMITPGAEDCTILLNDSASDSSLAKPAAEQRATPRASRSGTPTVGGGTGRVASPLAREGHAADAADAPAAKPAAPRYHWVDWLRVALTVLVIVHHCVCAYLGFAPWATQNREWNKNDEPLWLLTLFFVNGNQTYFMSLFFFLSGIYVEGSLRRKGAPKFLLDRFLRLVVPCLVYSFTAPPLLDAWGQLAAKKQPDLAALYRAWLKPGWPTRYMLPTGPPWFVWMLWWFNVAYVALVFLSKTGFGGWFKHSCLACCTDFADAARGCGGGEGGGGQLPSTSRPRGSGEYSTSQMVSGGAALSLLLFGLMYTARVIDYLAFNIRPAQFVQKGPFVTFMPDYLPVYIICFGLGIACKPAGLGRLPSGSLWWGWCLAAGGIWWTMVGWVPSVTFAAHMALRKGTGGFLLSWLLRTLVEQSFAVVWSIGLLVLFRDCFNYKPGRFGKTLIGAAYGAYIVHMMAIPLFARAIMHIRWPSATVNAAVISPMAVITSFAFAALLRLVPGVDRVL